VKVGQTLSCKTSLSSSVLQGSVMGPVLFVAYINEITEIPLNEDSHLILFADDIVLIHLLVDSKSTTQGAEGCTKNKCSYFQVRSEIKPKKVQVPDPENQ
jgi:hypothetical protein